ncbi:hypothetical protein [Wenyingzhuangia marina]|uniref:Uncharacterized protein n=1 Tax=Wenyingzhuangia marina TaxID=1195760 RepID=A0A1M5U452_9FLAO|nr:hypothetical protein [Wenyingzhuangia marina]GGF69614.1 hypothetical protein GCM10011397_10720 [Wenyingzhuangia marina]SHH57802.1 hypothetical protein SAMN05444281_1025 [Wenyingzhuangia marina]
MKTNYLILFLIIISISNNSYSQKLDSLLFENNTPKIENPNTDRLDSISKEFYNKINNLADEGVIMNTKESKSPIFFHVKEDGTKISLIDFFNEQFGKKTNRFRAFFKVEIDWNGQINFVRLVGYIGNIDNIDFTNFWKKIKVHPATEFNIPIKTIVTIPINKN